MKTLHYAPKASFGSAARLGVCLLTAVACFQLYGASQKGVAASTAKGTVLYTKFSLFHENSTHRTTNYRKGILVPINTEVTLVKATKEKIVVTLPGGNNLTLENVEEYSGEGIDGIFTRTFGTEKVDISRFSELERTSILSGTVKEGMKKDAVLLALGYPPKHRTPSLESDQWRFWRNRFGTFVVHFENGQVSRIQN